MANAQCDDIYDGCGGCRTELLLFFLLLVVIFCNCCGYGGYGGC
ncbi:MAG: hypothetical protein N4A62_05130 [Marinisporobacter sp.]|jgi:hypothetical protein|nr:hypothetical protein [Marinisporobacter sp.]